MKKDAVKLSRLSIYHLVPYYFYVNDLKLSDTYPVTLPFSIRKTINHFRREFTGYQKGTRICFAIKYRGRFVGICTISDIRPFSPSASVHYWIASRFWRRGIATRALALMIAYAEKHLELTSLTTGVLSRNIASRKVLIKNGFTLKRAIINHGAYHHQFLGEKVHEMKCRINRSPV